ncbi:MAG: hypothetical protein Q8Q60_00620 [Candidatus Chromulinivorax sp.]|nr:hypothetical protein [Candidatus Chromulinivorax sp.]
MNVKKIVLFSFFIGCILFFGSTMLHPKYAEIVNAQGKPSQALLELLSLTGIEHDGSLASIVQATQATWIRKPGTERWDINEEDRGNKELIHRQLMKMNLIDTVTPSKKKYDYALWMGAAYPRMQTRFAYLVKLWEKGVRFDQIVLLSGARPLTDGEQSALVHDFNLGSKASITEADAMKLVYENTAMPDEMRKIPLVVIDVPMQIAQNGTLARPTTGDTVNAWMALQPQPGSCLVVSNQPYVAYQNSVTKTLLPSDFVVETVGEKSDDTNIDVKLDTVAQLLYQE